MTGFRAARFAAERARAGAVKEALERRAKGCAAIVKWEPPALGSDTPAGIWGLAWPLQRASRELKAMRIRHEAPTGEEVEEAARYVRRCRISLEHAELSLEQAEREAAAVEERAQRFAWLQLGLWRCIDGTPDSCEGEDA